jgi:hypothetical protein
MPSPQPASTAPDPDKFFDTLDDAPKPPEPKPASTEATKPDPKTPAKPGEPKPGTEPAKPAGEKPEQFKSPKELRQAYDRTSNELKAKNAEVVRLLQQLETAKAGVQPNTTEIAALTERLARREKEFSELESELKVIRYEKSPEYKAKFLEPFNAATKRAHDAVSQLVITAENKQTGEKSERRATVADFNAVASLPEGAAWQKARAIFGEDAHLVMRHYNKLSEIAEQSQVEIERYQKEAADREKTDVARSATERQAAEAMSRKADEGWQKRSKWFAPVEGDDEGNALLKTGFERVDADTGALTPAQRIIQQSYVRHAAAAYPRLKAKVTAYETRIADLEAKLKEFENSEPGPSRTTPGLKPDKGIAEDAMTDPKAPWNQ